MFFWLLWTVALSITGCSALPSGCGRFANGRQSSVLWLNSVVSPTTASAVVVALLRASLIGGAAAVEANRCPRRACLPADATQWPPLCYQETADFLGQVTQAFAECPAEFPKCDACVEGPPCESRCADDARGRRPPGSPCALDTDCAGRFARCLQRTCRRALHTFQACDAEDANDVCVVGKKACFRRRCEGLKTGDLCAPRQEGRDIDCAPGWYCFLGICTPQLPAGHGCTGQHPNECVRGHRCNLADTKAPVCVRQYTLDIGDLSSDASLCKSYHISPELGACADEPEIEYRSGRPLVSGADCVDDAECRRADGSLGDCRCKRWWDGVGPSSYCDLFVQSSSRPAFMQFWETRMRLCHHDWDEDRCAAEVDLDSVLQDVRQERLSRLSDPTTVSPCAAAALADLVIASNRGRRRSSSSAYWVASALALPIAIRLPTRS